MSINSRFGVALFAVLATAAAGCARDPVADAVRRLQDPEVVVRRAAAASLNERSINDKRVVDALAKSVTDTDADVRYKSISALGKLGPAATSSLPALKAALQDAEKTNRLRAAVSIAKIDPRDGNFVPVLETALREGDGHVLLEIGAMGPDAVWAAPALTGLMSHDSPKVRALAAKALGHIGPAATSAKPALERALNDSHPAVQAAARQALKDIEKTDGGDAMPEAAATPRAPG